MQCFINSLLRWLLACTVFADEEKTFPLGHHLLVLWQVEDAPPMLTLGWSGFTNEKKTTKKQCERFTCTFFLLYWETTTTHLTCVIAYLDGKINPLNVSQLSVDHLNSSHLPWRACWNSTVQRQTGQCWSSMLASALHKTPLIPEPCSTHENLVEEPALSFHWLHSHLTLPGSSNRHG